MGNLAVGVARDGDKSFVRGTNGYPVGVGDYFGRDFPFHD